MTKSNMKILCVFGGGDLFFPCDLPYRAIIIFITSSILSCNIYIYIYIDTHIHTIQFVLICASNT